MTRHWTDALKAVGRDDNTFAAGLLKTRIDYFLVSKEWAVRDGGAVDSDASDHKPIWVEVGK
jgi:endonuclease/exonuclease/phosphatase family metal-dependent hydrolase